MGGIPLAAGFAAADLLVIELLAGFFAAGAFFIDFVAPIIAVDELVIGFAEFSFSITCDRSGRSFSISLLAAGFSVLTAG